VLTRQPGGGYRVSVRAPKTVAHGADVLCATFGGGGRAAAAGIDGLPADRLNGFVAAFGAMSWEAALPAEPR
jgi:hypothetical protein